MAKTDATLKGNLDRLEPLLAKLKAAPIAHVIGGARPAVEATFETHSPTDKSLIARVAKGSAADIDKAAQAAKNAFKSWANVDPDKRRALLHRQRVHITAVVAHGAAVRLVEQAEHVQQRRLAGAAGAEQHDVLAGGDAEVDAAQYGDLLPADAEVLGR